MADSYEVTEIQARTVTYGEIAVRLLSDNLLLTALELHTELVEAGREVPKLKEFFSNPGNFEPHAVPPCIPRSGSQATLDSLDLTRFSEDGERAVDERVAVLEFELRKARETISALRANLTVATESESTTPDNGVFKSVNSEPIKPHEQRALNFLINEYLLLNGYKLTSNTFSDENENQDFDDWDDVGLNISRPPELVQLYRESGKSNVNSIQVETVEQSTQTEEDESFNEELKRLQNQVHELELKTTIKNTSTVATSTDHKPISSTTASSTPDRFELVISTDDGGSGASTDVEWTRLNIPKTCPPPVPTTVTITDVEMVSLDENSETEPLDEEDDDEDKPDILEECPSGSSDYIEPCESNANINILSGSNKSLDFFQHCEYRGERTLPEKYAQTLATLIAPPLNGDPQEENVINESLVHVVGYTLNRLVPNVILNKRGEVVPLLVRAIRDHPDSNIRDRLLQLLFNLHKRPGPTERATCVSGVAWLARHAPANLIEAEVLPHCWEQLGHRHAERRQLAAQTCGVLAPSLAPLVRQSLLVSMLRQLVIDDRDENVRASAVASLAGVLALASDASDCESLALTAFEDASTPVSASCENLLAPMLFQWALQSETLHSGILTKLLNRLKILSSEPDLSTKLVRLISILNLSVPFIAIWLGSTAPSSTEIKTEINIGSQSRWASLGCDLSRPEFFINLNISALEIRFDTYSSFQMWPSLNWVIEKLIPELLDLIESTEAGTSECTSLVITIRTICFMLGESVNRKYIRPAFEERLHSLESRLAQSTNNNNPNDNWPPMALVPITIAGVCYHEPNEAASIVSRVLISWPLCGAPIHCLTRTVATLLHDEDDHREPLLGAIWEAVVHARPSVRAAAASICSAAAPKLAAVSPPVPELIANRLMPAIITLAADHEMSVRTATVPAFALLIACNNVRFVHDKCYVQLQTFLNDPSSREDPDMLLALVQALGQVLGRCEPRFRDEVALPRLAEVAGRAAAIESGSRRTALTGALMEALAAATEIASSRQAVLAGLRALETALEANSPHRATVIATIRSLEARQEPLHKDSREMRQRVTQIFQPRPATLPNLQSIFRKK